MIKPTTMATYLDPMYDLLLKYGVAGDDADRLHVIEIVLFVSLLCLCIILGHLLEENRWMNESITALLLVSVCFYSIIYSSVMIRKQAARR